ncbi:M1 family aminopeptidase [Niveispirillum sp.]|uniref:ABC transporter permease/M1 family aminopeptidase n=1 Tax=Niveispirillum sp. TaxID=1917217 RepID=UPI0025D592CD|nr:M1 family aminopeptidase [Niveispirillum sp.]
MFGKIAWFELRYQIRQPVFIVTSLIFGLLTFLSVTIDNIQIGSSDAVHVNSPFAVMQTLAILSIFGMFIPVSILANVVLRDHETKMAGIMHSLPVGKYPYLIGRFTGAFAAVALAFSMTAAGMALGSAMWWLDPETVGPFRPGDYLFTLAVIAIPNLLAMGAIFFAVATATRSLMLTYVALVAVLIVYLVTSRMFSEPEFREIRALLDPFGLPALGNITRYWTVLERNTQMVPFEGMLVWNRLIWTGFGLAVSALTIWRFSFAERAPRKADKAKGEALAAAAAVVPALPRARTHHAFADTLAQFRLRTWFEVKAGVKNLGFLVLLALGAFNALGALIRIGTLYGTDLYPLTRTVVELLNGAFSVVPLIVSVYFAGELVWRERQARFNEIIDATPTPNWVFVLSKFAAMALVLMMLMGVGILMGLGVQIFRGFAHEIEFGVYVRYLLGVTALQFLLFAVLSMFFQVMAGNKYLGMLIMVGWLILTMVAGRLGLEDNLLLYGGSPDVPLSDMNGLGHFGPANAWFTLYWGFMAIILMVLAQRGWTRGTMAPLRQRLSSLGRGWTGVQRGLVALCLVGFAVTGGYIFYNTHILNEIVSKKEGETFRVEYERKYRAALEKLPQPRITDVRTDADIFPADRRMEVRGHYLLENRTGGDIPVIHVQFQPPMTGLEVPSLELQNAGTVDLDATYNLYSITLKTPMKPGERLSLDYVTRLHYQGFDNDGGPTDLVANGSFINNIAVTPAIGFVDGMMLQGRADRRKYDLPPNDRMAALEDESQWHNNYLRSDSDFVTFETTVSTSEDQIAMAPGYLEKEWTDKGRRYFHYKMDAPILHFYSWLSARYTVKQDKWKDVDVSVLYHAPHAYNVDRMIRAVKDSLDYFSNAFGPYQHRQMRILEFPAYASFAQSFPNTVPYSEAIGFVADVRDPNKIDYVYYVTAHEVAHQWWAHQVMGANVQGATLLSESLSQYSALMVMEKTYGPDKIRRFLKYELDSYLRARGGEDREEQPLARVENQQYIHYRKGSVALYFLRDQLGEDVVNRALARLVQETKYKSDPYPRSTDLIRLLKEEAGPGKADLITDTLEKITLYDLKAVSASAEKQDDGRYKLALTVKASKVEADGQGKETKLPLSLPIDIGLFTASPGDDGFDASKVVILEKHPVDDKTTIIEFVTDKLPTHAGIDPYNKLIDRNSDDNIVKVEVK